MAKKPPKLFVLQVLKTETLHRDIFTTSEEAVDAFNSAVSNLKPEDADKRVVVLHQHIDNQTLLIRVIAPSIVRQKNVEPDRI